MQRSTKCARLPLVLLALWGCAVAETEEPEAADPAHAAGRSSASSGGKAGAGTGGTAPAGSGKGGTSAAHAGAAGSEDTGNGGSSGSGAGGKAQAGSGGVTSGAAGASAGASGSGGSGPAPGTVLFMDDFETGDAAAWQVSTTGDWEVALDGANHIYRQPTTTDVLHISWVSGTWKNVALQAKVRILAFGGANDTDIVCLYVRVADDRNHYSAAVRPNGRVAIRKRVDGSNTTIGSSQDAGMVVGTWYTVKLEVAGSTLKAYVDGDLINTQSDAALSAGGIGLGGDNSSAEFDDVIATAL